MIVIRGIYISLEMNFEFVEWHLFEERLGCDGFSVGFVFLRLWVRILMVLGQRRVTGKKTLRRGLSLFIFIYFFLVVVFVRIDYIRLYLAFEAVLFPTVILIFG